MKTLSVDQAVDRLKKLSASQAPVEAVRCELANTAVGGPSLKPFLHFAHGRYTRNLIYRDEHLEMLALCWGARAGSAIHDHAQQECYLYVQSGEFEVQNYRVVEGGRTPGFARVVPDGPALALGPGAVDLRGTENPVHRIALAPGQPFGVTLHVYSRPIDRCLIFQPASECCDWKWMSYDSVGGRIRNPIRWASDLGDLLIPDAKD